MKLIARVAPYAVSAVVGFLIAFPIFMIAWNFQIEHRAYRCTDDVGFGFFWESMETHKGAGDTVLPGWTWQKLKIAQAIYETGFLALMLAIAAVPALARRESS